MPTLCQTSTAVPPSALAAPAEAWKSYVDALTGFLAAESPEPAE